MSEMKPWLMRAAEIQIFKLKYDHHSVIAI